MMARALLGAMLNGANTILSACTIHLFKNNVNPAPDDDFNSTLIECDFPGYASMPAAAVVDIGIDPATGEPSAAYVGTDPTFTCDAVVSPPQPCYGYYMKSGTDAVFCGPFGSPVLFGRNGDSLTLVPKVQVKLDSGHSGNP